MKAVIFDMDGVIIDSEPVHFQLERELLEEFGGNFFREKHGSFLGTTDYHMWSSYKKLFSLKASVEEIIEIKKERFCKKIPEIELVDNFMEFMLMLYEKGYKMALASSNNRKAVDAVVERFNLDKYFNFIISGEDVSKGKPDPEIFLTAANNMKVEPKERLVIEDATNGVMAAKAAGMKCIGLKNPNSGKQDLSQADLVVENFNQLNLDIIKDLFK